MIIVDPNCISSFVLIYNRFCESSIDSDVVFPTGLLPLFEFWIVRDLVMERWPDDLLAVSIIMAFEISVGYEDGNRSFLCVEIVEDVCLHRSAKRVRGLQLVIYVHEVYTIPSVPIHL